MFGRVTSHRRWQERQERRAARVLNERPLRVANEELRILMSTVQDLIDRLGTAADPELKRLRQRGAIRGSGPAARRAGAGLCAPTPLDLSGYRGTGHAGDRPGDWSRAGTRVAPPTSDLVRIRSALAVR